MRVSNVNHSVFTRTIFALTCHPPSPKLGPRGDGEGGQDGEQQGVGRDVEVEIGEAVDQDGADARHGTQGDPAHQAAAFGEFAEPMRIENHRKPSDNGREGQTGIGRKVQVVVMGHGVMFAQSGQLVAGDRVGIGTRTGPCKGVIPDHYDGTFPTLDPGSKRVLGILLRNRQDAFHHRRGGQNDKTGDQGRGRDTSHQTPMGKMAVAVQGDGHEDQARSAAEPASAGQGQDQRGQHQNAQCDNGCDAGGTVAQQQHAQQQRQGHFHEAGQVVRVAIGGGETIRALPKVGICPPGKWIDAEIF